MGKLDQFAKLIFLEETAPITGGGAEVRIPPEIGLHEVRADALMLVHDVSYLGALAAPWCLVDEDELVLELKMQGDKLDRMKFDRALLRRQAREVERREATKGTWRGNIPLWFIAPHLPRWLESDCELTLEAEGVYRVSPYPFQFLWIASNRLPLRPELIPFLLTRKDNRLLEFARWVIDHREVGWLEQMIEVLPMTPSQIRDVLKYIPETDDPERLAKRELITRELLGKVPKVKEEVLAEGRLDDIKSFYALRLGRELSPDEEATIAKRNTAFGVHRLRQVFIELSAQELAAWLADPDAH